MHAVSKGQAVTDADQFHVLSTRVSFGSMVSKKALKVYTFKAFLGGDKRDRTADLLTASQALSQLSYTPMPFYFYRSVRLGTSDNIAHGVETVNTFLKKFLLF